MKLPVFLLNGEVWAHDGVEHAAENAGAQVGDSAAEAQHAAEPVAETPGHTPTEATQEAHGAHHDAHAIPWSSLTVQAFNFFLLLAILIFMLRKSIAAHFKTRASEYQDLVRRADAAKSEAEAKHRSMKDRLAKLEQSAASAGTQAKAEADALKTKLIAEAQDLAKRLQEDAKRTAAIEIEKAKAQLRQELLTEALSASKAGFQSGLGSSDQKKLQSEFVDKIQVVGQ